MIKIKFSLLLKLPRHRKSTPHSARRLTIPAVSIGVRWQKRQGFVARLRVVLR